MFVAHDIAGWLGIPTGIVIAALIILRRQGMALRARNKQRRAAGSEVMDQPSRAEGPGRLPWLSK
jgi:hypothetical protein